MLFQKVLLVAVLMSLLPAIAAGQQPPAPESEPERSDPDMLVDPLEPDFALFALPTTLRMPAGKWAFRVTHRFTRSLGQGDVGDLASSLFGLDGGAQIGLEFRVGLRPGTQVGVHRTSDRSIQLFLQQNLRNERDGSRLGLDAVATLEGGDNLSEQHQSAIGLVMSKRVRGRAALYAEPLVVLNANPLEAGDDHTLMIGLGGRLRLTRSTYLLAEYAPRVLGFEPAVDQMTFAFESRAGGHLFQLNVGNGFGSTLGQLARGGVAYDDWFLGFSLSRKFF